MKNLLLSAKNEIVSLRRRNEILSAKVEMIDLFACILHTKPATPNCGAGIDIVPELAKKLEELESK